MDPCACHPGAQQHAGADTQAHTSQQAASGEAPGNKTKEPQSGFDDVVMPDEASGIHNKPRSPADGAGPSGEKGTRAGSSSANQGLGTIPAESVASRFPDEGAFPDGAEQDDEEPEATLPGGTATEGSKSSRKQDHSTDTKQKKLDWTAASAGRKRKGGSMQSPARTGVLPKQATRTPPKRQCKLKLTAV